MRSRIYLLVVVALVVAAPVLAHIQIIERARPPVRTFPEFVGTWVLDPAASTGRMNMAPPPAVRLTIATSPTDITVTRVFDLPPERPGREGKRMATNNPPPEVYRLNGSPTVQPEYPGGAEIEHTFTLVADALALTSKRISYLADPKTRETGPFTAVTDALSVIGDVLTLDRQLTSVNEAGQILVMREPTNQLRHTYVYRRAARAPD